MWSIRPALAMFGVMLAADAASGQLTERVSVGPGGIEANQSSYTEQWGSFLSFDGRYVAFRSAAYNLVPGDTNASWDIFVRDRVTDSVDRVSVDSAGNQSIGGSNGLFGYTMTSDGRFVAFYSESSNLVPGDTNGVADVFLHDRLTGSTERVSVSSTGSQANDVSQYPALSNDGRYVAFNSVATNLTPGDTNSELDIFVRDRRLGITERISVSSGGAQGNDYSYMPTISADGRLVAFHSLAGNLVAGDNNLKLDVFVRDRVSGTTTLASLAQGSLPGNLHSSMACISADGRYVAFLSSASNLVPGDTNDYWDVFVRDLQAGTTERVSVGPAGIQADGPSYPPSISADGRCVAFMSGASNLVPGIMSGAIFVHDRLTGTTECVSLSTSGVQPNNYCESPAISGDGRHTVFRTAATNLVPGDTNGAYDVFLHDRFASGFASCCDPGTNNVLACPCANPPAGSGRGCDNSASTGGASLTATGIAYLAQDNLVFTAAGERPNATSLLLQGDQVVPTGLVFGQGVRCAGGTLKRLFVKVASNGSITAPDFGAGDPSVSARSAALGAPIQAGQPYAYLVYYRDPIVLGGCPAASTFNATQTGQVSWWP